MMKQYDVLLHIVFDLLRLRRVTAKDLSEKYQISPRTVHRYIARLTPILPLHVARGRGGGIFLSDSYRLPTEFLTAEEYDAILTSLSLAYAKSPKESFLSAKRKITATEKESVPLATFGDCENFLFLPTANEEGIARVLHCIQQGLQGRKVLRLLYLHEEYAVEPHLLLLCKNKWILYGFCHTRRAFAPFPLAHCRGILVTDESFRPRNFDKRELYLLPDLV